MQTIGENIKKIRKSKKIKAVELAEKIGVSNHTIYKYENNIIANIPLSQLEKIANALEVKLFELLEIDTQIKSIVKASNIIKHELFHLNNTTKNQLLKTCNNYYHNNIDYFCTLEIDGQWNFDYKVPLTENNKNKDILDFAYKYNLIDNDFIENIKDNEKIEKFKENKKSKNSKETLKDLRRTIWNATDKIMKLQKEIIDITNQLDNFEEIKEIRDIAQLKLNKMKK